MLFPNTQNGCGGHSTEMATVLCISHSQHFFSTRYLLTLINHRIPAADKLRHFPSDWQSSARVVHDVSERQATAELCSVLTSNVCSCGENFLTEWTFDEAPQGTHVQLFFGNTCVS